MISKEFYESERAFVITPATSLGGIIEYDMKSANVNSMYECGYIDETEYLNLLNLNKKDRVVEVGKRIRDYPDTWGRLPAAIGTFREQFMTNNGLLDSDILLIMRDAVFVINKVCTQTTFGPHGKVVFIPKNVYTSYMNVCGLKFLYNSRTNVLDVKGINDKVLEKYNPPLLEFIKCMMGGMERDDKQTILVMRGFYRDFTDRKLDISYYRELAPECRYTIPPLTTYGSAQGVEYICGADEDLYKNAISINTNAAILRGIWSILTKHFKM